MKGKHEDDIKLEKLNQFLWMSTTHLVKLLGKTEKNNTCECNACQLNKDNILLKVN